MIGQVQLTASVADGVTVTGTVTGSFPYAGGPGEEIVVSDGTVIEFSYLRNGLWQATIVHEGSGYAQIYRAQRGSFQLGERSDSVVVTADSITTVQYGDVTLHSGADGG